ncbi:hypothetical protein [Amycolatopsis sp. YIM 10]|uniref:hypothetical protein n=1 Tax=Amycolatopsis sp. YIM 10 TaxID=2653857 RepID=UPI0012905810|nr:hypothetical protein [Amycolatopsis sp. YIM 10]QFU91961.1 hypothetical protein YIM_34000 [Amycolatopsis sp. YIM 10]
MADDELPVLSNLAHEPDKRLRTFFKAYREVLERKEEVPPAEAAARARTGDQVAGLRDRLWAAEARARTGAIADWAAAHPLELPRLPGWRRHLHAGARERLRQEYEEDPERQRFIEEAVRAEAERFYAAYREEHGVDFLEELGAAYAADHGRKRVDARTSAWSRIQDVVRVLYERHDEDVRWVADYLGTTQVKVRSYLGIPEPRTRGGK